MANPTNGSLPPYEYVELFNTGIDPINLKGFSLQINNASADLPNYLIAPQQYVILTKKENIIQFERYGNVIGLDPWPILTNTGANVQLFDNSGSPIDYVNYSDKWYLDNSKRDGGWSLERVNPTLLCNLSSNWQASQALSGGTPGKQNSVQHQNVYPSLHPVEVLVYTNRIELTFNQPIESSAVIELTNIDLKPNIGHPKSTSFLNERSLSLLFDSDIPKDQPHQLHINQLQWCETLLYTDTVPVFLSSEPLFNDIIINEVLFNPPENGVDFVEIYNASNKVINLQHWKIGNRQVTDKMHLFYPHEYRVLTTSLKAVQQNYPKSETDSFIELPSLPAYANQQGIVTIYTPDDKLIDSLHYTATMHQPFLKNQKGISLERQSTYTPTLASGNFSSASTIEGGATPGYQNSRHHNEEFKANSFDLTSRTFSPDNDYFEDSLVFSYTFQISNPMINLTVYDQNGKTFHHITRNQSLATQGEIRWNGQNASGNIIPTGTYIYLAEVYNNEGYRKAFKGSFICVKGGSNL